jgi:hypothetical protein
MPRVTSPQERAAGRQPIDLAWASLTFLVPMLVSLLSRMGAIDLAYHLRAGVDVLAGNIPRVDTYTFTVAGHPWLDQQWGAQGILALLFKAGGWPTLMFAQGVLVGLTFFLVYLAARASGAGYRTASLLTIGGFVVASPGLAMRPQLLALPLFGVLLWVTAGRSAHPARLWAAPVLAAVCANIHGSFTMFPLVLGLAWLDDRRRHDPQARRTLLITAVTALATLLNPFGLHVWTYAYDLSTNPVIRDTISEWAPLTLATVPGWFAIVSALAVAVFLIRRSGTTPWTALVTLGIFLLLALSAQRAIVWWGMVAPVVLAGLLPEKRRERAAAETDDVAKAPAAPAYVIIGVLIAGVLVLAPWWRGSSYDRFLGAAPPGLTAAVADRLPPGTRLLVDQPWGSWFEYAVPNDPVFVDSRIEIVPKDIWHDYGQVGFSGAGWKEVLDRWNVQAIVANADWDLLPFLEDPNSGWKKVYEDDDGALFVRA